MTIHQALQKYWGYPSFRPLQEDIINAVLQGYDTLALMPTGGGKSICFQVPALVQDGICIVISPLIALMKDQVFNLQKRNIKATAIFSGMSRTEIDKTLDNCVYGDYKFLYISPERLQTELFTVRLRKMNVNLIAIDESHCISQWGYDFRPAYLKIASIRNIVPDVPLLALTATATPRVKQDIQDKLEFKAAKVFTKSFTRKNLSYSVFHEDDKLKKMLHVLNRVQGSGIVYVRNRKKTKTIAQYLQKQDIRADFYHAGLPPKSRSQKQENWINNKIRIMVCTNAFGMGIDKSDVRIVVHVDVPESLEAYYQEAGRGGRDLKRSFAVLLYHQTDIVALKEGLTKGFPELKIIKQTYQSLCNYLKIAVGAGEGQTFDFDIRNFCQTYNLRPIQAFSSLKILEEDGYVILNDAIYMPSRLMIIINKTELYKIEVANRRLEPYIKMLLRMYGGLFDNFVKIDEKRMAQQLKVPVEYVKNALGVMEKYKIINYQPQKNEPSLTCARARVALDSLKLNQTLHNFRREVREKNIQAVTDYAQKANKCRSQQLVSYFGELDSEPCGSCDVCIARKKQDKQENSFASLSQQVQNQLAIKEMSIPQLTQQLSTFRSEEVIKVVRWLLDNEVVVLGEEGELELKNNS